MSMKASDLARYVIVKCCKDKTYITNIQLQKIMFFLQVKYIERTGKPLFCELFEAWHMGPVIPNVYYKWCCFGVAPITYTMCKEIEVPEDKEIIDAVVEETAKMDILDLITKFNELYRPCKMFYSSKNPYTKIPLDWLIFIYHDVKMEECYESRKNCGGFTCTAGKGTGKFAK